MLLILTSLCFLWFSASFIVISRLNLQYLYVSSFQSGTGSLGNGNVSVLWHAVPPSDTITEACEWKTLHCSYCASVRVFVAVVCHTSTNSSLLEQHARRTSHGGSVYIPDQCIQRRNDWGLCSPCLSVWCVEIHWCLTLEYCSGNSI